jgi:hypothetical protein
MKNLFKSKNRTGLQQFGSKGTSVAVGGQLPNIQWSNPKLLVSLALACSLVTGLITTMDDDSQT